MCFTIEQAYAWMIWKAKKIKIKNKINVVCSDTKTMKTDDGNKKLHSSLWKTSETQLPSGALWVCELLGLTEATNLFL